MGEGGCALGLCALSQRPWASACAGVGVVAAGGEAPALRQRRLLVGVLLLEGTGLLQWGLLLLLLLEGVLGLQMQELLLLEGVGQGGGCIILGGREEGVVVMQLATGRRCGCAAVVGGWGGLAVGGGWGEAVVAGAGGVHG